MRPRETGQGRALSRQPLDDGAVSSRMDALVDVAVHKYAPLSASTLGQLVRHLRGGPGAMDGASRRGARRQRRIFVDRHVHECVHA